MLPSGASAPRNVRMVVSKFKAGVTMRGYTPAPHCLPGAEHGVQHPEQALVLRLRAPLRATPLVEDVPVQRLSALFAAHIVNGE